MTALKSEFLQILSDRGFIHQATDLEGLDALMQKEKIAAYIGFDCTASSLHVGSLMQIMVLRWLQKTGHKPIVLIGGGTTRVGDPSGRDESRRLLDHEQIAENMRGIQQNFAPFIRFGEGASDAVMVNNDDWLKHLTLVGFLCNYGRDFSISRMLSMESVKRRLEREQHLSFLEFSYMVLQAYDFAELNRVRGCLLQIGGSDQWGNITAGIGLMDRKTFGLTTPLITTASGAKMGKTAAGAVWLNADLLSPFDYWQFWRNTEDADVGRFLRFFTELPLPEIVRLESLQGAEINEAKKILATEATALCHGRQTVVIPEFTFPRAELGRLTVRELLVQAGFASSSGEAKKLMQGGGVRLNNQSVTDASAVVKPDELSPEGTLTLSKGKKHRAVIRFTNGSLQDE